MNSLTAPFILLLVLSLAAISLQAQSATAEYSLVEWTDLIPEDDLNALMNPPAYINDIADGSEEDVLGAQIQAAKDDPVAQRYQQALQSKEVKRELNKRKIKIPGFIVPLNFDDNMVVSEFFLVPFFGACLHLPPPPPNQMIHITHKKGIRLTSLNDPFYVEGTLLIQEHATDDMGTASYSLEAASIYPYTEDN